MSTSDATSSDLVPEATPAGAPRMDVETTQQMIREMTTLTSALFSLLQPHRAPAPETSTPAAAPITPAAPAAAIVPPIPVASIPVASIPLPSVAMTTTEAPVAPKPPAQAEVASIPLPSMPVPDLPSPEPELEDEDQPSKDSRQSMALMNEIAFLDD